MIPGLAVGSGEPSLKGLRVLVAEDEGLIALDIVTMLQDLGCEVVGPVPRLQEVLRLARSERLDGAILDVNLRGEHIFAALPVLQERRVPVILSSGYDDPGMLPEEFRSIARVTKPYNQGTLDAVCRRAFLPAQASPAGLV